MGGWKTASQSQNPKRQNYLDFGDKSQIPEEEENRTSILKIHGFFSGKRLKHQLFLARYETNIDDQTWGAGWPPLGLVPAWWWGPPPPACPCWPPPRPWWAPPLRIGARNSNMLWELRIDWCTAMLYFSAICCDDNLEVQLTIWYWICIWLDLLTWVCWDSIFSRDCGMGSLQKKSWLRAVSESILASWLRVRKTQKTKNFCVLPGWGVEGKQPVQKVDSPLVLHVRLQPLLDTPVYYVMISELCINVYDPPIYYIMIS